MRMLALLLLASLLAGCAIAPTGRELTAAFEEYGEPVPPGTIIAEVASIEDHATNLQAPCRSSSDCVAPLWYTYRARVNRVITGQQIGQEISFANLQQSGFDDAAKQRLFVFLTPAGPAARERLKVQFVASRILFKLPGQHRWAGG